MAWTPFSAEAIRLDLKLRKLHEQGRTSDAIELIVKALEKARRDGPEDISSEEFERAASFPMEGGGGEIDPGSVTVNGAPAVWDDARGWVAPPSPERGA